MADFGNGLGNKIVDAFHLFPQAGGRLFFSQRELGAIFDEQKILAKAIVQFGGDPRAFSFLGGDQLAGVFCARILFTLTGLRPPRLAESGDGEAGP